jgi:hypothetical protein
VKLSTKAFDRVEHSILLDKLSRWGVRGKAWDWLNSYLSGRKQYVELNGGKSDTVEISVGVPQGSVLGPLLFLAYANDMHESLTSSNLYQYADDSNVVSRGRDAPGLEIETFVDMNMVQQWLDFHVLPCNYSKTNYVLFRVPSKPNLQLSLFMGDAEIERVPEVKFLGIIIDEHLTWASQVNDCCRRLSSAVFGLRSLARVSNYDKQVLLMVYHGLFMSVARYGILAWGATSETNMNKILKLQKRAIRIITGLGWLESCRGAFRELNLLTLPSAYIFDCIMFTLEKSDPTLVQNVTGRVTRRAHDLHVSPRRLLKSDSHALRQGKILFNALPRDLKTAREDLKLFKRLLKDYLVQGTFYSVNEFKGVSGVSG